MGVLEGTSARHFVSYSLKKWQLFGQAEIMVGVMKDIILDKGCILTHLRARTSVWFNVL